VVRRILAATRSELKRLIGDTSVLRQLEPEAFTDAVFGVPTVTDILRELEKPGRDPRPAFKTANFREGVEKLEDLKPGMVLDGVVTNVAAFGAFVDVGVTRTDWCTSPRWPMLTSRTHAKSRSPAMSSMSRCWRSTQNAVGSR
jgi:transcriptional accessory protein Tex/SPT6